MSLSPPTQERVSQSTGTSASVATIQRKHFMPSQPTTVTPGVYGLSNAPFRLFGFALTRDFLNGYCERHNIGGEVSNAYTRAIYKIMLDADVEFESSVKTVYTGGFDNSVPKPKPNYATCLVLANNKPAAITYSADEDITKRVRDAMGVDTTPMWYKQF